MGRSVRYMGRRYGSPSVLVASSNSGRFALDREDGYDLTCGQGLSVLLGGQWVDGCVEYTGGLYPVTRTFEEVMREAPCRFTGGYIFEACDGNKCGLCVGMRVRLIEDW
jgi:hypothetical protein